MFVLHVGPHKTATTWIQTNLHANAGALEKAIASKRPAVIDVVTDIEAIAPAAVSS